MHRSRVLPLYLLLCRYESEVALQTQDVTLDACSSNEMFDALGIKPESIERLAPEYLRRFREGSHYKQVRCNTPRHRSDAICFCSFFAMNQNSHTISSIRWTRRPRVGTLTFECSS